MIGQEGQHPPPAPVSTHTSAHSSAHMPCTPTTHTHTRHTTVTKNKLQIHPAIMYLTYIMLSKRSQALFQTQEIYSSISTQFKSKQKQFRVIEVRVIITSEEEEMSGMEQRVGSAQSLIITYFLNHLLVRKMST